MFDVSDRCLSGFHVFSFVEAVFQCLSYMIYTTVYKCILYIYTHVFLNYILVPVKFLLFSSFICFKKLFEPSRSGGILES